jgi:hypothetical protein
MGNFVRIGFFTAENIFLSKSGHGPKVRLGNGAQWRFPVVNDEGRGRNIATFCRYGPPLQRTLFHSPTGILAQSLLPMGPQV